MGLVDEHLGASMHVNLSLRRGAENALAARGADGDGGRLMRRWIAGLLATMPGAMSFFSPNVNSYRRLVEIAGPPTTVTWGRDNKSTALRIVAHDPASTRIEHRVPAIDCNPYLGLAAILAGGLIGIEDELEPPRAVRGHGVGPADRTRRPGCPRRSPRRPTRWPPTRASASCSARRASTTGSAPGAGSGSRSTATAATPTPSPTSSCSRYFEHV